MLIVLCFAGEVVRLRSRTAKYEYLLATLNWVACEDGHAVDHTERPNSFTASVMLATWLSHDKWVRKIDIKISTESINKPRCIGRQKVLIISSNEITQITNHVNIIVLTHEHRAAFVTQTAVLQKLQHPVSPDYNFLIRFSQIGGGSKLHYFCYVMCRKLKKSGFQTGCIFDLSIRKAIYRRPVDELLRHCLYL